MDKLNISENRSLNLSEQKVFTDKHQPKQKEYQFISLGSIQYLKNNQTQPITNLNTF